MRFSADCMLGKLAKWLRILGFDVAYFSKIRDAELLNITRREGRTLLTRDLGLIERAKSLPCLMIESEKWRDQLVQVIRSFGLSKDIRPHSRCLECNRPLKFLPANTARNLVSPFVFEKGEKFVLCPGCGRVYWRGTHVKDMEKELADLLRDLEEGMKDETPPR